MTTLDWVKSPQFFMVSMIIYYQINVFVTA